MKTLRLSFLAIAVLAVGTLGVVATADDAKGQTFTGSYDWRDGGSDELTAEFKPSGDNAWDVTFRFRWNDKDHKWQGTASGSLTDGQTITGTATTGSRNWTFEATIAEGVMQGEHIEQRKNGATYNTGTFKINR